VLGNADAVNDVVTSLALVVLFVLIGGFFAASELALVSLRDSQVERLPARRGDRVRKLRSDPNRFLASVQVGVTLAGFFASAYGGSTLSGPLSELLTQWGVPAGISGTAAFIASTSDR
jgi:putative hemolysin